MHNPGKHVTLDHAKQKLQNACDIGTKIWFKWARINVSIQGVDLKKKCCAKNPSIHASSWRDGKPIPLKLALVTNYVSTDQFKENILLGNILLCVCFFFFFAIHATEFSKETSSHYNFNDILSRLCSETYCMWLVVLIQF